MTSLLNNSIEYTSSLYTSDEELETPDLEAPPSPSPWREVTLRTLQMVVTQEIVGTSNGGKELSFRKVLLINGRRTSELPLRRVRALRETYSYLQIVVQTKSGEVDLTNQLSPAMLTTTLNLLTNGRPHSLYDCGHFAAGCLGIEPCALYERIPEFADTKHVTPSQLDPGDVVLILDRKQKGEKLHFAVKLHEWLLSLFGSTGPLAVASLESKMNFYGGVKAVKVSL